MTAVCAKGTARADVDRTLRIAAVDVVVRAEAALGRTTGPAGIADEVAATPGRLINQQVVREAFPRAAPRLAGLLAVEGAGDDEQALNPVRSAVSAMSSLSCGRMATSAAITPRLALNPH